MIPIRPDQGSAGWNDLIFKSLKILIVNTKYGSYILVKIQSGRPFQWDGWLPLWLLQFKKGVLGFRYLWNIWTKSTCNVTCSCWCTVHLRQTTLQGAIHTVYIIQSQKQRPKTFRHCHAWQRFFWTTATGVQEESYVWDEGLCSLLPRAKAG